LFQLEGGGLLTAAANGSTKDMGVGGVVTRPVLDVLGVNEALNGLENDLEWAWELVL